jgi:dihydroorotase
MSTLIIRGGRVIDPAASVDAVLDILVEEGKIAAVAPGPLPAPVGAAVIEGHGRLVLPGLIDLHTHLREPGEEYKEDIASGTRAAAAGGFTSICCMANTQPPNDNAAVTEFIVRRAREVGVVNVFPVGAVSKGLAGETLAEIGEMKDAGAVAVSDDGRPVMSAALMRRALEYARSFDLPVIAHEEDLTLSAGGSMHEGFHATRLGLRGIPAEAEEILVLRDLALVRLTGGRLHIAHVSTARAVEAIRLARAEGVRVTAEATPHHLFLTDVACSEYDPDFKMNPPLRTEADRAAVRAGLADGTIGAIATDHAPHSVLEKECEFELASNGVVGLETALPLMLRLVEEGVLPLGEGVRRLTQGPAGIVGLPKGTLAVGADADLVVVNPSAEWVVDPKALRSRSRNTAFKGWRMRGRASVTIVGGKVVHTA